VIRFSMRLSSVSSGTTVPLAAAFIVAGPSRKR
jgi:hypothetical protein